MTDQTPILQAAREPRLHGVVDVLRGDRVAGWVIDRTDPARCAVVEVRREGRLIGTVTANRPRKDLERQAVGTGAYGFALAVDPPLDEGMEFTISVTARSHDGVELPLQPAAGAARSMSPEKRALGRILSELSCLRDDLAGLQQESVSARQAHAQAQERLELVQLRLERGIACLEAPPSGTPGWLTGVAIAGAVIAAGSLALGLFSLWVS